ncbi:MAG: hypothetical protein HC815_05760 [Richelia sp. RM1_1_1]|nr:hypothetical protein [Richelia sp. RM1_1_1]
MPIKAISLRTGLLIAPSLANFNTYLDELPRCQSCLGEVCLAKGEKVAPHWRYFPGVGIGCPDKSEESNNQKPTILSTDRKQILAEFKKRFLQILDIGIHGKNLEDGLFASRSFSKMAERLSINCNGKKVIFSNCLLDIIRLSKNSWMIIEIISKSKIDKLFSRYHSLSWDVDSAEYIQMLEIIEYKDIQVRCAKEACKYVFSRGREDILKELAAHALMQYHDLEFDIKPELISTWLIQVIMSLLSTIPWYRIMSDFIQGKEPSCEPITVFGVTNEEGLTVLKKILIEVSKKPKPKGFSSYNKRQ